MNLKKIINQSLQFDRIRLSHYRRIASSKVTGRLNCRWDKRRSCLNYYYSACSDSKEHYIRQAPNSKIWKLQMKRYAQEMIRILTHNIKAKELLSKALLSDEPSVVLEKMPRAYRPNIVFQPKNRSGQTYDPDIGIRNDRPTQDIPQSENPYKREELTIVTSFGLVVRTKGEMDIAEILYSLGIEFFYERALTLDVLRYEIDIITGERTGVTYWKTKTYYPDFTIILPNGRILYWEHKGLLEKRKYVERDVQKTIDYNMNGIYQSHNLIVTEEGPNNALDNEGIKRMALMVLELCTVSDDPLFEH